MNDIVEKALSLPYAARLLIAINVAVLAAALTLQHGFGIQPCILCQWQRIPYLAAGIVSAIALLARPYRKHTMVLLILCTLLYLTEFGLAAFHSGVERHLWEGTSSCAVVPVKAASLEDLRQALLATPPARCDEIPWSLFGLSIANLNLPLAFVLALFSLSAAVKLNEDI